MSHRLDQAKITRLRAARLPRTIVRPDERLTVPQRSAIRQLERRLGHEPADLSAVTKVEASVRIDAMRREVNEEEGRS